MEWLSSNWVLLALLGGCIAMHVFGHGRHGGHHSRAGGRGCCGDAADDREPVLPTGSRNAPSERVPGR